MHHISLFYSPDLHICVWRMNEIFRMPWKMSDYRNTDRQGETEKMVERIWMRVVEKRIGIKGV